MKDAQMLSAPQEKQELKLPPKRSAGRFLAFLLCASLLLGAFAVSGFWMNRGDEGFWEKLGSFWKQDSSEAPPSDDGGASEAPTPEAPPAQDNPSQGELTLPVGATPILSKDLSAVSLGLGRNYIHNETVYQPDPELLRQVSVGEPVALDPSKGPVVLILHTHAPEAYALPEWRYLEGRLGDLTYSTDPARTVVAVGEVLCQALNQNGVPTIHCTQSHGDDGSLRNSYAGAADCIREYLQRYPTIRYVVDVHRDGILTSGGEYVRTLAEGAKEPTAQVMAVVGSDGNGTKHPAWQSNLSLALQLNDRLGSICETMTRPVSLRNASYNQEMVPCALLLEIGSGGNTVDEAKRAAGQVGQALAAIILQK